MSINTNFELREKILTEIKFIVNEFSLQNDFDYELNLMRSQYEISYGIDIKELFDQVCNNKEKGDQEK